MYMNNTIRINELFIDFDTYDRFYHEIQSQFQFQEHTDGVMLIDLDVDESVADSSDVAIIESLIR